VIFVIFKKPDILKPIWKVIQTFCQLKILIPVCAMLLYVAMSVFLLYRLELWRTGLLKDTIVWFCISAIAMVMRFVPPDESKNVFKTIMTDNLKIVIILEFIVNTYTFSLPVELIIVPVITCLTLLEAVAGFDKKNAIVEKFVKGVLGILGLILLIVATKHVFDDFQNISKIDALRSIVLVPLLSILISPFIYLLVLYAKYDLVFLRLDLGREKTKKLKRYARYRIIMFAGLSLRRLEYILKNHAMDLMHLQTESDLDILVQKRQHLNGVVVEKTNKKVMVQVND
jgi:hypothetical protein